MMQVDVDECYEWQSLKSQVVFVITITVKIYGFQDLVNLSFVKGNTSIGSYQSLSCTCGTYS